MSALVNAFIAGRHRSLLRAVLWALIFAALLIMGYGFIRWQIGADIRRDQAAELGRINEVRSSAIYALQMLQQNATAEPCSRDFLAQMQKVAFLPDGLNEFLYAPGGSVACSTSQPKFEPGVPLGAPDIAAKTPTDLSLHIDRDLSPLGRPGTTGTIATLGSFAVAIPPYSRYENGLAWMKKELVARDRMQGVWNVAGDRGLYQEVAAPRSARLDTIFAAGCDAQSLYCVASQADLFAWARTWLLILSSIAVLAGLFAWICADNLIAWLAHHWSFEERFKRGLDAESIVLTYQPIVDLHTDEIVGCEVLTRWRDVNGTLVVPERFIDIVARIGRTAAFTQMVVDRAFAELSAKMPGGVPLQINFNVFTCDFESTLVLKMLGRFIDSTPRFKVAVELVENHDIDFNHAQRTIQKLAAAGVKTYIDDFGTGYSSIERVATLAVHGVKLDRSFAMAPTDSVMGRMLVQVIEMIKTSGRVIVVEGVETFTRLNLLRSTGLVDCVQGYVVSRPLCIEDFVAFLHNAGPTWKARIVAA